MSDKYVVRGGEPVLIKKVTDPPAGWKNWTNRKVMYLEPEELVSSPDTDPREKTWPHEKVWTFRRSGWLISVKEHQFFSMPPTLKAELHIYRNGRQKMNRLEERKLRRLISEAASSVARSKRTTMSLRRALLEADEAAGGEKVDWSNNYEAFVNALKGNIKDPKVKAFIGAGKLDGDESDDKFKFADTAVAVSSLVPTQNEIDINGSLKWAIKDAKSFLGYVNGNGPFAPGGKIVIYNGKYVIDGHHRWSQVYCCNKDAEIEATDAQIEGLEPLEVLKAMQASIAYATGGVPTQSVQGTNLLKVDKGGLDSFLDGALKDDFVDAVKADEGAVSKMKQVSGSSADDTKQLIKDYIWSNVEQMKKTSQPISGAPKRDFMPQTDNIDWKEPLAQGVIDIKTPHGKGEEAKGTQKESANRGDIVLERWQKLAGLIKG